MKSVIKNMLSTSTKLSIKHTDTPSPYSTIERVFCDDELKEIIEFVDTFQPGDHWLHAGHEPFTMLQDKAWEIFNDVYPDLKDTPDKLNNMNVSENDSFFRIQLKRLEPGFERNRIHRDSEWKQLVVVIYLSTEGDGTVLYKENDPTTVIKTIPFKQNSAYAHIPCDKSWHDFSHSSKYNKDRISIMFLLANKRFYK